MDRYDLHIYFGDRELVVSYGTQNEALEVQEILKAGGWYTVVDKLNNSASQVNGNSISYMEITREVR
jgi:hypothetical protein